MASGYKTFLIDGFPRTLENWEAWNALDTTIHSKLAIHFICPDEVLARRVKERQRSDDTDAAFARRMRVYKEDSMPLLGKFERVLECESTASIEEVDAKLIPEF